ncbi:HU domain-containing protein [Aquimarina intermedia]|uniref:Sporulation related protein n=1 Tax=Aquimarina intermedia TaxID=350814 RepID=A0A5S5CCS1_9FLAO|nr:SPOR domain-containing protein [Aquimarina intermedia]TYP76302.1 sporulation related protein [Aquimarina intermedia]
MNTSKYISELLYRYECVIIPGFGAFLTRRESARILSASNTFLPPKKTISFNSQLQNNDGLLANYIASAENISYIDAVAAIQRFVASLNLELNQGKRVTLNAIGHMFRSVENTLQFEPATEENYLTEAFGLPTFISPQIQRNVEVSREVYKQETELIEAKAPIAFTPEKRAQRTYLNYAATAAIIVGLFGLTGYLGLSYHNSSVEAYNYTQRQEAAKDINNMIQEATFEISSPLPAITLNIAKEHEDITEASALYGKYHIVAGAFRIEANAKKKMRRLKAKGFEPRLIGKNKYGLHQVVYSSYSNRMEALQALQKIKYKQDRRAWLLVQPM